MHLQHNQGGIGCVYQKAVYFLYTDDTFQKIIKKTPWLGFLGPVIKTETGDSIYVHVKKNCFKNVYSPCLWTSLHQKKKKKK